MSVSNEVHASKSVIIDIDLPAGAGIFVTASLIWRYIEVYSVSLDVGCMSPNELNFEI